MNCKIIVSGLPTFHLRVRHAVVLPRIMPITKEDFVDLRSKIDERLSALLALDDNLVINASKFINCIITVTDTAILLPQY